MSPQSRSNWFPLPTFILKSISTNDDGDDDDENDNDQLHDQQIDQEEDEDDVDVDTLLWGVQVSCTETPSQIRRETRATHEKEEEEKPTHRLLHPVLDGYYRS